VERLQVERVLERMNRFLRMIHRTSEDAEESRISITNEILKRRDIAQITERLESSFPVLKETLQGARPEIGKPDADLRLAKDDLRRVAEELSRRVRVVWEEDSRDTAMYGTTFVEAERLLGADDSRQVGEDGIRRQPFALHLRSAGLLRAPVLHCISPIGIVRDVDFTRIVELQEELRGAKLSEVPASEAETYTLMAEGDVVFTRESAAVEDVFDLLERVAVGADLVERALLKGQDAAIDKFRGDLHLEAERG
jgi:hypothetical protein